MSAPVPSQSRGRAFVVGLLLVAAALVAIFFLARRPSRAARPVAEAAAAAPAMAPAVLRALAAAREGAQETAPGSPIIDDIQVEKQEVCEGEENLITIRAHTPAGRDDAFLHYAIGGMAGRSIPIRGVLPMEGREEPRRVQVFGRGNAVTAADVPHYTVKKCRPDRVLFLSARQMPNSSDELELVALVRENGPSPPLRVTSYRWSFGDGASTATEGSSVVHRFEPSNPDALYSEPLVTCEAMGSDGRSVVGRTALSLRNIEFENLEFHKTLVLSVEFTPRFPELDASGQVAQRVRLYHHRSAPVHLERASVSYRGRGRPGRESSPEETHAAAELLGTAEVPPGHGIEQVFRLDTKAHPDAIMADYFLEGHTADGVEASASFSIMVPPAPPTAETGTPVVDDLLTQKILRARERLGKPYVNDEDLRELEREGAFADLKVPPPNPTAPAGGKGEPSAAVLEAAHAAKRSAMR